MSASDLLDAHLAKASLFRRVEAASKATCEASALLAALARKQAPRETLDEVLGLAVEASRAQYLLIIEAAEIDRRIQEASQ